MRSFQLYTNVCPLYSFNFTRSWGAASTGVASTAHTVLQPRGVGERVSLMRRAGRRQTLHSSVIVLCGLRLVLLYNTGKAAGIGGGARQVMALSNGRSSVLGSGEHLWRALIR